MRPGIYLVCDPHVRAAQEGVARMLYQAGVRPGSSLQAGLGRDWAAAVVPPHADEKNIGSDLYTDGRDLLIWSGELHMPDNWFLDRANASIRSELSPTMLRRLQERGIEILGDIDGSFCGAWFDQSRQRWSLFNDRLGLLPVFWTASDERLVAAPHARLAWLASGEMLQHNDHGVIDLLRTGNMVDDHTLIEGVHWLKPAHAIYWGEEGCGSYPYWDLSQYVSRHIPVDKPQRALDTYHHVLSETLERHSSSESPLLQGISGGMDSRVYLALCSELNRLPRCFTAGFSFNEDVRFGRQAARAVGAEHEWVPFDSSTLIDALERAIIDTDGLHTASHMAPGVMVREYLRHQPGHMLLEGYFHGAQAGQYIPADEEVAWDDPPHTRTWATRFLHAGLSPQTIDTLLIPQMAQDSFRRWKTQINDRYHRAPFDDRLQKAEYTIIAGRSGRIDVLGTALLRDHVHVRTPACEKAMLIWLANTSPALRRGKQLCLDLIKRRYPELAKAQRANAGGMPIDRDRWLREKCWQREKLHRWYANLRHPWTRRWGLHSDCIKAWTFTHWKRSGRLNMLTDNDARIRQWVRPEPLRELWSRAERDPLQASPIMTLATVEIGLRSLEGFDRPMPLPAHELVRFRRIHAGTSPATDKIATATPVT